MYFYGFDSPDSLLLSFPFARGIDGIDENGIPESLLLGYSGGADSSLLLYYLDFWCKANGVKLYAAHVNHGIRGNEALRDREHCIAVCRELGIEVFVLDTDIPKMSEETGMSIEEAAREARYGFFSEIMEKYGIPVLATAHNGDDNAETLIFRLSRGSGLRGLCGIPSVRKLDGGRAVIRPMLSLSKDSVIEQCSRNGIEYVYDSTNSDTLYTRNGIRANVIPEMKKINPSLVKAVKGTCESLKSDDDFIFSVAEDYLSCEDCLSVKRLSGLHRSVFVRVIIKLFSECSAEMLEEVHLRALVKLISGGQEGSSLSLPGKIKASVKNGGLVFFEDKREIPYKRAMEKAQLSEGENQLPFGYTLNLKSPFSTVSSHFTPQIQRTEENIYKLFTQVTLQSDKICGSLFVRSRLPGDKIDFGSFSKDIRDLFSEKKIPKDERQTYPIVFDDKGALWIPGIGVRSGAKADKKCENVTVLTLKQTF